MSFSIIISGHATEPHNEEVQLVAEAAYRQLAALPGATTVSLGGYTNDGVGGNIALSTPPKDKPTE